MFKNTKYLEKAYLLIILLFIGISVDSVAQTRRVLKSHDNMKRLEAVYPEIVSNRHDIEVHVKEQYRRVKQLPSTTIPIIFHIIHHTDEEKISEAQVYSQIDALNRDFGELTLESEQEYPALEREGFRERLGSMGLNFCFPDAGDTPTDLSGINYYSTSRISWQMDDDMKYTRKGGANAVFPDKVLNIWVVNLEAPLSGYAQMPGAAVITDGIVIDYEFLGTMGTVQEPYHLGKTLTHLVGNYLGLHDLWGEYRCADDYVHDTPIHNSPNYGCVAYKHFTTCENNQAEMFMNFMDNSDDVCLQMFTIGQKLRLYSFLVEGGARASLLQTPTDCSNAIEERTASITRNKITTYPTPTDTEINVEFSFESADVAKLVVTDLSGKVVSTQAGIDPVSGYLKLNCEKWEEGIYFLSFYQNAQLIASKKVLVTSKN